MTIFVEKSDYGNRNMVLSTKTHTVSECMSFSTWILFSL